MFAGDGVPRGAKTEVAGVDGFEGFTHEPGFEGAVFVFEEGAFVGAVGVSWKMVRRRGSLREEGEGGVAF